MGKKQLRADTFDIKNLAEYLLPGYQSNRLNNPKGIFEFMPKAVIVTDEAGRPVSYNQTAMELLGKISPETHPEDWPKQFGFYLPDGKTEYPGKDFPLLRALKGENVEAEEVVLMDGRSSEGKWITFSALPLIAHKNTIEGALVFFSDISTQKQEDILREKQARFAQASYTLSQQISKISNDPLQILNTIVQSACETVGDGCVAALINASRDRLKIIASRHNNSLANEILHNAVLSIEYRLEGTIEKTIRTGEPIIMPIADEARMKLNASPEQVKYIDEVGIQSMMVVPIKGRDGILGTLSLFRDRGGSTYSPEDQTFIMDLAYRTGLAINHSSLVNSLRVESSVRRIAEKALELSEVRFQSIFTSTALGIKLLDLEGNILETNPAFRNTLGYTEDELRGKPIVSYWHPEDAKLLIQLLDKLKNDRVQSFQLEHRLLTKDRTTVWFNVTFTGIKKSEQDESLAFIVAIAENITKRKRLEAEMVEMKSRLHSHVEMERLQLAQELHDGPLQDLYSAIYKIENWDNQENRNDPKKVELLKQDLLKVVQELRNTAKNLRPPALTNFGLEKAIRSHAEEFNEDHPEIALTLNLAQDRQTLPEDIRLILFRIYQNSMTNIIRHAHASEVHVRFAFDAEEAHLEVKDNGVGFEIPSSWIELVRQGHFGLAGAVERVALLGGTFIVDSLLGKGTTVRVVIPILEGNDTIGEREEEN